MVPKLPGILRILPAPCMTSNMFDQQLNQPQRHKLAFNMNIELYIWFTSLLATLRSEPCMNGFEKEKTLRGYLQCGVARSLRHVNRDATFRQF
jgi:hypothetical protein